MYIYIQKSLGCTSFGGLDNHVKAVPQEDVFLAALSPREMLLVSTGCKNLPGVCHTGGFLLSHASDLGESLISNKGNYSCSSINYDDLKGSPVVSWMQWKHHGVFGPRLSFAAELRLPQSWSAQEGWKTVSAVSGTKKWYRILSIKCTFAS